MYMLARVYAPCETDTHAILITRYKIMATPNMLKCLCFRQSLRQINILS